MVAGLSLPQSRSRFPSGSPRGRPSTGGSFLPRNSAGAWGGDPRGRPLTDHAEPRFASPVSPRTAADAPECGKQGFFLVTSDPEAACFLTEARKVGVAHTSGSEITVPDAEGSPGSGGGTSARRGRPCPRGDRRAPSLARAAPRLPEHVGRRAARGAVAGDSWPRGLKTTAVPPSRDPALSTGSWGPTCCRCLSVPLEGPHSASRRHGQRKLCPVP